MENKSLKILYGAFLIAIFVIGVASLGNNNTPTDVSSSVNDNEQTPANIDAVTPNDDAPKSAASEVMSWWNNSYGYRKRVEVTNPLDISQTKPVSFYITFEDGKANTQSIRLLKYSDTSDSWTLIPCEVWNTTVSGTFLLGATITFVAEDLAPGTSVFYVYYDPDETYDPTDYSTANFEATLTGDVLTLVWDDATGKNYTLQMRPGYGVYNLTDAYGVNRHTGNSSSPGVIGMDKELVAYWSFDDNTPEDLVNTYVPDGTPTGYLIHGDVYFDTGYYGQAAFFDGSGDYISINADDDYLGGNIPDGFTIMAWVLLQGSGTERIIASWDRSEYYRFAIDAYNRLYFATAYYNAGTRYIDDMYSAGSVPADGQWHHVTATYDATTGTKKLYIDGVLDSTRTPWPAGTHIGAGAPTRYGFIGVGSESAVYDGTIGPYSYYDGGLDELRIYKAALTEDEINRAMNLAVETADINSITEVLSGKVMAQYEVEWTPITLLDGVQMNVTDTWTFYRSLNYWKITRTYVFNQREINPSFAAWNTLYNYDVTDLDPSVKDYYYYDGQLVAGHDATDFTTQNYTVVHDYDGDNNYVALGLFITDKRVSLPSVPGMQFDACYWKVDVDSRHNLVNFIPGNETVLDTIAEGPIYNISIDYWEFAQDDFIQTPTSALSYFDNLYTSLRTEDSVSVLTEEKVFFNLQVTVKDIDGNPVPNATLSLSYQVNGTDIGSTQTSDDGVGIFYSLVNENYSVNITYGPYGLTDPVQLGVFNYTLNETETTDLNTKAVSVTVNMTSLTLTFISSTSSQPIVGAQITFALYDGAAITQTIARVLTDSNGQAVFRWANDSTNQIDVSCLFLGSAYLISKDNITFLSNLQYDFTTNITADVFVQIDEFETLLSVYDSSPTHIYGETLYFDIYYAYNISGVVNPITDATITYKIQYRGTDIATGSFASTDAQGYSNNTIDYKSLGIPLETGKVYTLRVTAEKTAYTTMEETINFEIEPIPTSLTMDANSTISVYWMRNITVSFYYYDTHYDKGINDASLTYILVEDPNFNGTVNADPSRGDGWYTLTLNSTEFGSFGNYSLIFYATKTNYEEQLSSAVSIKIKEITTDLTIQDDSISVYWNENLSLAVRITDTLINEGINDASVSWALVGNTLINGNLTRDEALGDGWYSTTINSTLFSYAGFYNIKIDAVKANYVDQTGYISVNVKEIYTHLNGESTPIINVDLYRTESKIFTFNYTYRIGGEDSNEYAIVKDATFKTYEWSKVGDDQESGTGTLTYDEETGLYVLDFDTANREIGQYTLTVRLQEINYVTRVAIIYLNIVPREFNVSIETFPGSSYDPDAKIVQYSVKQDETFNITIDLSETLYNMKVDNATVLWQYSNGTTKEFYHVGDGIYTVQIQASANAFFQRQLMEGNIIIQAPDFENVTITAQIVVQMPEIYEGVPTFYFLLGVGAVSIVVVSLAVNKAVQSARIPAFVKLLEKIRKSIEADKPIPEGKLAKSVEEEIIDRFEHVWKLLDLDLKSILGVDEEGGKNIAPSDMK